MILFHQSPKSEGNNMGTVFWRKEGVNEGEKYLTAPAPRITMTYLCKYLLPSYHHKIIASYYSRTIILTVDLRSRMLSSNETRPPRGVQIAAPKNGVHSE